MTQCSYATISGWTPQLPASPVEQGRDTRLVTQ